MVLLILRHGFALRNSAFHSAFCVCYGWHPPCLPAECLCVESFVVEHALSCGRGLFSILRHSEIRDLLAPLIDEVCTYMYVMVEPELLPVLGNHRILDRLM